MMCLHFPTLYQLSQCLFCDFCHNPVCAVLAGRSYLPRSPTNQVLTRTVGVHLLCARAEHLFCSVLQGLRVLRARSQEQERLTQSVWYLVTPYFGASKVCLPVCTLRDRAAACRATGLTRLMTVLLLSGQTTMAVRCSLLDQAKRTKHALLSNRLQPALLRASSILANLASKTACWQCSTICPCSNRLYSSWQWLRSSAARWRVECLP